MRNENRKDQIRIDCHHGVYPENEKRTAFLPTPVYKHPPGGNRDDLTGEVCQFITSSSIPQLIETVVEWTQHFPGTGTAKPEAPRIVKYIWAERAYRERASYLHQLRRGLPVYYGVYAAAYLSADRNGGGVDCL